MPSTARALLITAAVASIVGVAGCAAGSLQQPAASPSAPVEPSPTADVSTELGTVPEPIPTTEVLGQGLVLDDGAPELCLGDVGASLPPTCGGERLAGWDWTRVDGWEEQDGVRWGAFAVRGTWDGDILAVAGDPISLALYDPAPVAQPAYPPSTASPDELERIRQVITEALGDRLLSTGVADGALEVRVVFDDGTVQAHPDEVYGAGTVRIESALQAIHVP